MQKRRIALSLAALAALALPGLAHAQSFDVEAATRAYLDTLQGAARAKSDAYFEGGYWLILWGALVSFLTDALMLRFRISAWVRDKVSGRFARPNLVVWGTALLYGLWGSIVTFPWAIYTGFLREQQYGLMNQSFGGWLGDQITATAISLVFFPLMVVAIYAVIRRFPRNWWMLATGVVLFFVMLGALIAPVYIAPLFNKYTELPAGPVRDRIVAMAKSRDVPAEHIYLFDASKQTKRISANVSGLGPTIRISLNDNLLNRTTLPETAAVMGHEMGHYVLGHVWRGILVMSLLAALVFFAISRAAPALIARYGERWGVRDLADPASMPVFGMLLAMAGLLVTPITNTLVRVNESDADAFGLDVAREPDGFALTAMKLSEYRKIEPGPIEEMLFFDHPSGATRVRMSMQWKKDHVPGAQMVVPPPMQQDQPEAK
ncbi:M48 family metallopeptidase [Novosphingobium sp. B 225]|uniref:M48 family metallopeptidase n=1 Tax=Novosphingobium sp. B 225 TaxID=1961849 RepID=UPI000B4AA968|nr:M48 family metallopeptidase [Novosphingobium sp. B 225]